MTKWLIAVFLFVVMLVGAGLSLAQESRSSWEKVPAGWRVYAEVAEVPSAIYRQPVESEEFEMTNRLVYTGWGSLKDFHLYLNLEAILWVEVVDPQWVRIIKTRRVLGYTGDESRVYLQTKYLRLMDPKEFAPIGEEHNPDRLLVIMRQDPTLYYFEGAELRMKVPVFLSLKYTYVGDYRTGENSATLDMPGGLYGVRTRTDFDGGNALHGTFWRDFSQTARGGYGTNGCVNLPGNEWYKIQVGDQWLPVDLYITNVDRI